MLSLKEYNELMARQADAANSERDGFNADVNLEDVPDFLDEADSLNYRNSGDKFDRKNAQMRWEMKAALENMVLSEASYDAMLEKGYDDWALNY